MWASRWIARSPSAHAFYPVRVPRLARLLHASFRPHLAVTPLRFAIPSPPPGWEEDSHLQAAKHARHTILRSLRFHEKARECQGHRGGLTSCCWLGSTVAPTATGSDRQASIRTRCEPPWARCTLGSIQFGCCNLAIGVPSGCVKRPDGTSAATAVTRTGRWTRVAGRRIGFTVRSQEHFPRWRRLFLSGSEARADSSFGVVERVVGRLALPQTVQEDGQLACNGDHGSFLVFL